MISLKCPTFSLISARILWLVCEICIKSTNDQFENICVDLTTNRWRINDAKLKSTFINIHSFNTKFLYNNFDVYYKSTSDYTLIQHFLHFLHFFYTIFTVFDQQSIAVLSFLLNRLKLRIFPFMIIYHRIIIIYVYRVSIFTGNKTFANGRKNKTDENRS